MLKYQNKEYAYNIKICLSPRSLMAYQAEHPEYTLNTAKSKIQAIANKIPGIAQYHCINPYCLWYFTDTKTDAWEEFTENILHEKNNAELRLFTAAILSTFPDGWGKPKTFDEIAFWRDEEQQMALHEQLNEEDIQWMLVDFPIIGETESTITLDEMVYE